ncbi:MAG: hypothetical protein LC792_00105 [Actinobacteria bacterium]|nr:hypothetical protein [Actinomycetota bacterium]
MNRLARWGPPVLLLVAVSSAVTMFSDSKPSVRDDEVFLQAAYLMRTQHVRTIEGVVRAAENQYGWGGSLIRRAREQGDIQTYALLPLWSRVSDFRVSPSPWGRPLYVESHTLSRLSKWAFLLSVVALWWAVLPLGEGVAVAAALLVALGHPFRHGPALFDPWVMPLVALAIGFWLRDRHRVAAALTVAAVMVKPNYVFLLPAFLLASLVAPGRGDPPGSTGRRPVTVHAVALVVVGIAYLALAAGHVIAVGQYANGVRSGYDPGVLAYSLLETLGFWYRAGTQQLRRHWPVYPWAFVNLAALAAMGRAALSRHRRLPRTAALLGGMILIPALANFMVMPSVFAYEDGGHFRWINVSIVGMAVVLPLAYRELAMRLRAPQLVGP